MFGRNVLDSPEFLAREASASLETDWIEPKLRFVIITFDMHVWRFITITGIEEESVWTNSQNGGHQSFAKYISFDDPGYFSLSVWGRRSKQPPACSLYPYSTKVGQPSSNRAAGSIAAGC